MNVRTVGAPIGVLILLLALLVVASIAVPALAAWRLPIMIFAGVVSGVCLVSLFLFTRRHTSHMASHEAQAESEFERTVLREMQNQPAEALSIQAVAREVQPVPVSPVVSPPSPQVGPGTGLEGLMMQLRLARLEPSVEGEMRQGPFTGGTIVRLGRGGTALVLPRMPSVEEWETLFPRYDRIFVQKSDGKWLTAERLESLMSERIEFKV